MTVELPPPRADATALVTGASSGIGHAIARDLARRGYGLTLVARRESRLRQLADELSERHGTRVDVVPCDLTDAARRAEMIDHVGELGRDVELLVNNAGTGTSGRFIELARVGEIEQVRLMNEAVVDLCGAFAPAMAARRRGGILIVASGAGFQPMPNIATYAAAKAFLLSFGEALHTELHEHAVTVTTLMPGPVDTEFFETHGPHPTERFFPRPFWQTADEVARVAVEGLARNRRIVIPSVPNRLAMALGRYSPHAASLRVFDRFYRAPRRGG